MNPRLVWRTTTPLPDATRDQREDPSDVPSLRHPGPRQVRDAVAVRSTRRTGAATGLFFPGADISLHQTGYDLRWPYDVVQFSFLPDDRQEPVIAVDAVEAGSTPILVVGGRVPIVWPLHDPRSARIAGARPAAPWANWLYDFGEFLLVAAGALALVSALPFVGRRWWKAYLRHTGSPRR